MYWYQRHITDYLTATQGLTMLEDGAYGRLLDYYYSSEKPLPKSMKEIRLIARATCPAEYRSVESVVTRFFVLADDGYRNARCDAEIEEYHRLTAKNRENGKRGGRPKKPSGLSLGSVSLTQTEPKHNPSRKPLTDNQEEIQNTNTPLPPTGGESSNLSPDCKPASERSSQHTPEPPKSAPKTTIRVKSGSNYSDDFNRWFAAYPRRVAKGAAWKAWPSALAHFRARSKAATEEAAVEELINITVIYALSPKCVVEPEFIPHPATWLTARRFEDDPKEWQRVSGGASVGGSRSRVVAAGTGQVTPGDDDPFTRR